VQRLAQAIGLKVLENGTSEIYMCYEFDLSTMLSLYSRMAAYVNNYAQPKDRYNIRRSVTLLFRTATQGERELRQWATSVAELLNPSLKGYFEALTERDRFIAQIDQALEPWDIWLTPVAAPAFTHRPAWSAVEMTAEPIRMQ